MYEGEIFIFGSKLYVETIRDAITSLPLELSWKIFSYLDGISLRASTRVCKRWRQIILFNKTLRNRLNKFELSIMLGSARLAKFHRRNTRRLKKEIAQNYLPLHKCTVRSYKQITRNNKREGEDFAVASKRFKLY